MLFLSFTEGSNLIFFQESSRILEGGPDISVLFSTHISIDIDELFDTFIIENNRHLLIYSSPNSNYLIGHFVFTLQHYPPKKINWTVQGTITYVSGGKNSSLDA